MTTSLFLICSFLLLALGIPVCFALALGSISYILTNDISAAIIMQRIFTGLNSTTTLCIPFFILSGDLMAQGGIADKLIDMCKLAVGRFSGGLAYVSILACTFFAAVTGSAVACCMALGVILLPAMIREGYDRRFATGVITVASTLGPVIPPSVALILFAQITGASVADLYAGSFPAGLLIALLFMIVAFFDCKKYGYKGVEIDRSAYSLRAILKTLREGIWALGTPVIILGGIFTGFCTPTEAAVVAVLYSLVVGMLVYRKIKISMLPKMFVDAAVSTARVMIIVACANLFSWVISYVDLPQIVLSGLSNVTTNPTLMMLILMGIVFIMGMFLEPGSIMLIAVPIFAPIIKNLGISLEYFGIVLSMNTAVGNVTPPFGTVLFTGSHMGDVPVMSLAKQMLPYMAVHVLAVIAVIFIPGIVTWAI